MTAPSGVGIIYLASPLRGDIDGNTKYAKEALYDTIARGEVAVAPHLLYPQVLDDRNPADRERGLVLALRLLKYCDRLVIYADRGVSVGMQQEIAAASDAGIPIEFRSLIS